MQSLAVPRRRDDDDVAKLPPGWDGCYGKHLAVGANADEQMSRPAIGFTNSDNTSDGMEAIKRIFTPEFRNRLDAVIQFAALDPLTIERVVDKLIVEVEMQLEAKGVTITLDDAARRWVAEKGYDPKMGARPMARLIQEQIKRPLAEELLFGKLVGGGHVNVSVAEDGSKLKLQCNPVNPPLELKVES